MSVFSFLFLLLFLRRAYLLPNSAKNFESDIPSSAINLCSKQANKFKNVHDDKYGVYTRAFLVKLIGLCCAVSR